MQALMLAAGMGKRLGKYTNGNTKCMVEVAGVKLIDRTIEILKNCGIKKLVMVVGYQKENLKEYIRNNVEGIEVIFIDNDDYDKSNNIYSLYMAKDYLAEDDTIMLESDLIYEEGLVREIVESENKNVAAVAKYEQWMDGTVVTIDEKRNILDFVEKKDFIVSNIDNYYKTVNIYKLSKEFSSNVYIPFLDAYMKAYGLNEYYELALKAIAHLSRSDLKALDVSKYKWYEIDDAQDLDIANCLFSDGVEKLKNYQKRFGGYWRFESLKDFCYLVNPYFPPQSFIDKVTFMARELIADYPSGLYVQNLNAGRLFNVDEENIMVGNGAAELINLLGKNLRGKMAITVPSFNEYIRCFSNCEFDKIDSKEDGYRFNIGKIMAAIDSNDIITIINPDNPSGSFISYDDMIMIIDECYKKGKRIIVDESFIDFASKEKRYTLIQNDLLTAYPNLVVIKSISKSYGIPGVRLGVLATTDKCLMSSLKDDMAVWNINSFGEYFLQNATLYKKDYEAACDSIAFERARFIEGLSKLPNVEVYDSEANYVLCKLDVDSTELATNLLKNYAIFIKDLKTKSGFEGENYVRLAVRDTKDNDYLLETLSVLLTDAKIKARK